VSEPTYHKTVCKQCNGSVEFPEESEGATVACPHCGKDLFLYRGVRAVGTPPANQPAVQSPIAPLNQDSKNKYKTFAEVPWFRREPGPITLLLLLVFSPVLLALCIIALTGDVYRNAYDKNGNLVTWGIANKIAAILILLTQFALGVVYYEAKQTEHPSNSQTAQQTQVAPVSQQETPQPQQQTEATPETAQAQPQKLQSDWNRQETDAIKNGNISFAVRTILAKPSLRNQATMQDPQTVAKTPWNYYGQVVRLTGEVGVVQDFPAGSDYGQMLGGHDATDIVVSSQDGTIIELFCMKPSGNMKVGDTVNLYVYPTGIMDVPNRLGGNDVHLILVGNDYDILGVAQ